MKILDGGRPRLNEKTMTSDILEDDSIHHTRHPNAMCLGAIYSFGILATKTLLLG